jgi:hypothetical protein
MDASFLRRESHRAGKVSSRGRAGPYADDDQSHKQVRRRLPRRRSSSRSGGASRVDLPRRPQGWSSCLSLVGTADSMRAPQSRFAPDDRPLPSTDGATKLSEHGRTHELESGLNEPHQTHLTSSRRYRTQEVAGASRVTPVVAALTGLRAEASSSRRAARAVAIFGRSSASIRRCWMPRSMMVRDVRGMRPRACWRAPGKSLQTGRSSRFRW